jgi:glyoxylase-like metal-dependent hydrolase (beta-lactamase superfamily II)
MHRLTLGDFELSVFSDGTYPLDGGAFLALCRKSCGRARSQPTTKNYVTAGLNSLVIRMDGPRTGKQTVLVETGMGNKLSERMVKFYGQPAQLLENLAAAGIAPDDVDIVINSHLHFDHCGWNTVPRQVRQDRPNISAREILRARRRMAVCAPSQRTRCHQLYFRELRSAGRERPDDVAQGRRRI